DGLKRWTRKSKSETPEAPHVDGNEHAGQATKPHVRAFVLGAVRPAVSRSCALWLQGLERCSSDVAVPPKLKVFIGEYLTMVDGDSMPSPGRPSRGRRQHLVVHCSPYNCVRSEQYYTIDYICGQLTFLR